MNRPKEERSYPNESDEEMMGEGEEEYFDNEEPSKAEVKPNPTLALRNNNSDPIEPKPKVPPYQPSSNLNMSVKPSVTNPVLKPTEPVKPRMGEPLPTMGKEKKPISEDFQMNESAGEFKKSEFAGVKSTSRFKQPSRPIRSSNST